MKRKSAADLVYRCRCQGECRSDAVLASCIMRTSEPDSYCQYCKADITETLKHRLRRATV